MPDDSCRSLEILQEGLARHEARLYEDAECLYRTALALRPREPIGLYLYGSLALATGRIDKALELLSEAIVLRPGHVETRFAYANALFLGGARDRAARAFEALLSASPGHVGARVNLSNCLRELRQNERALAEADAAVELAPKSPEPHVARGAALLALGRRDAAVTAYRSAIRAEPRHGAAYAGLASSLLQMGHPAAALAYADGALSLLPDHTETRFLRAMAMSGLGLTLRAITELEEVIARHPTHAKAHLNLANLLANQDRNVVAERLYRKAIELEPRLIEAYVSLASVLIATARLSEAIVVCDAALAIDPDYVQAHWNQGIAFLLAGDYERGWEKYESRSRRQQARDAYTLPPERLWQGEDLCGRTILVVAEQGLGDTIQFARYLRLLAEGGASVILACDKALCLLFEGQTGVDSVVVRDAAYPAYDYWVREMSLPLRFGTRLNSIPLPHGYLQADAGRVLRWRHELPTGVRVGIIWAGNPYHSNDARRSMRLAILNPVLDTPGVTFVSLQVGPAAAEAHGHSNILDVSPRLTDFAETAALMTALDLVVSVDTSGAHCAAALGKETWVMLPHAPDWRWLLRRPDSPWYATVRLFRQEVPSDWASVVASVKSRLEARLAGRLSSEENLMCAGASAGS